MLCRATIAGGLLSCVLLAPRTDSGEPSYRFLRIAQSSSAEVEVGFPVLNQRGDVASFLAMPRRLPGGRTVTMTRVFRSNGRRQTTIAHRHFPFGVGDLSINDRGVVAFPASLNQGEAIFRGSGGALATVARTDPGRFEFFTFGLQINNRAQVAFGADLDDGDEGVFLTRGRRIDPVYLASQGPPFGNPKPRLNDRGQVAFATFTGDEGEGVFLWEPGRSVQLIASQPGVPDAISQFAGEVSLNNEGEVAVVALLESSPDNEAILVAREGETRRIVDDTGPYASFGNPSLNDMGEVAFLAELDGDGEQLPEALVVAAGKTFSTVIRTGDPLDGSTVTDLVFAGAEGFNNRGQLAFGAHLADGRFAIFRADRLP